MESKQSNDLQSLPLLEQVRFRIRAKHYSRSTEHSYVQWIKRYILFHRKRHPKDMSKKEVEAYLSHLRLIYLKMVTTLERYRNSWAIRMLKPPRYIHMY